MTADLIAFITHYGYLAIFILIFLQEIGLPDPVPNEFILLFSGYLAYAGVLKFWLVFGTAIAGDFIGTLVLYTVFYYFGKALLKRKPRWLPVSRERIDKIANTLSHKDWWGVYLGRLIPYLRGYTSVAAGLLQMHPGIFVTMVFLSAITWSGGYVIVGKLFGSHWNDLVRLLSSLRIVVLMVIGAVILFFILRYLRSNQKKNNQVISPDATSQEPRSG
jgi:membrane protein DedA with SNARE-associated domain